MTRGAWPGCYTRTRNIFSKNMSDISAPPENINVDTVRTDDEALTKDTSQSTRNIEQVLY